MRRIHLAIVFLLALAPAALPIQAQAQATRHARETSGAQAFAAGAATASQFAIAASQHALKRTMDLRIRRLAEEIIADYQAGYAYILEAAAAADLRLPEELDADHRARLERLAGASAQQIDGLFMLEVAKAHEAAIALFTDYIRSGDNLRFRLIAARALPTLKDHYANVQQLAQR